MDSSGLHLLVTAQEDAERRGIRFSLIRGPESVARALELSGLQGRFEFV
jgi:anti-anti-sigma factor